MRGVLIPASHAAAGPATSFDVAGPWQRNPQVAVRPEPFGALLYHFGTRKLSFLKNLTVLEIVQTLADHPSAAAAISAAGVDESALGPYLRALTSLAASGMIIPRQD